MLVGGQWGHVYPQTASAGPANEKGSFQTKQMEFEQLKKRWCGNQSWTRGYILNDNRDITKGMKV
jgi:hypothetical protein